MEIPTSALLTANFFHCIPAGWDVLWAVVRVSSALLESVEAEVSVCLLIPAGGAKPPGRAAGGRLPGSRSRWLFLPVSFPLFPSLLCGLPQHPNQPSASKVKSCQTWRRLPGFFSSLGFNKEKQITKMEIFKLAFSGIQIDVWVARRHRPHACYFVIKMIPKIPPCFGFSFSKTSCFFPSSNRPSPWGAATP